MQKQWAKIPGFANYEISSFGEVVKIGKTKRIPIKVSRSSNYVYASLTVFSGRSKQINLKTIMDECFEEHIYSDHSSDDLEGEEWRDVTGWGGSYEISNLGRLRTKRHYRSSKNDTLALVNSKIKQTYLDEDGYERASLYENNSSQLVGIHRLVATAFIPNPYNSPQVNHINGNKSDNRAVNLEWVTGTQNIQHSIEIGLRDPKVHSRSIKRLSDGKHFNSIAELHREIGGTYNQIVYTLKQSKGEPVEIAGQQYCYEGDTQCT